MLYENLWDSDVLKSKISLAISDISLIFAENLKNYGYEYR